MEFMRSPQPNNMRKGQFLWMNPAAQKNYLKGLKDKIAEGYYFSEGIYRKVADELAPVIADITPD